MGPQVEKYLNENFSETIPNDSVRGLEGFVEDVTSWQSRLNLISPKTMSEIWDRHILDSLQLLPLIKKDTKTILDFGSGGGFPAIPLSIILKKEFTLVESITKKCTFLKVASRHARGNVEIKNARIEEIEKKPYDLITSRAMAPLTEIFSFALAFFHGKTYMLLHKGEKIDAELEEASKIFDFTYKKHPSITDAKGVIIEVSQLRRKDTIHGDGIGKRRGTK